MWHSNTAHPVKGAAGLGVAEFFRRVVQAFVGAPPLTGPLTSSWFDGGVGYHRYSNAWKIVKSCNGSSVVTPEPMIWDGDDGHLISGVQSDWYPQAILVSSGPTYTLDDSNVVAGAWNHCGTEGGAAFSWILIEQIYSHDQLLFAWNTAATDPNAWALYWSPSGAFTGGDANHRPTATDEITLPLQKPLTTSGYCITPVFAAYDSSQPTTTIVALKDDYVQYYLSLEFIQSWLTIPTGKKCICTSSYSGGTVYTALSYENKSSTVRTGHTFLSDGTPLAWAAYRTLGGSSTRAVTCSAKISAFDNHVSIEPIALVAEDGVHGIAGFLTDRWWGPDSTQIRQYRVKWDGFSFDRGNQGWTQVGDVFLPQYDGESRPGDTWANSEGTSTPVLTYSYFMGIDLPPIGDYALDTTAPTFGGIKTATATSHNTIDVTWDPATDDVHAQSELVYVVCVRKQGTSEFYSTSRLANDDNAVTLTGLEPGTTYEIYMECRDPSGNQSHEITPVVLTATTDPDSSVDVTPPTFGGITGAAILNENTVRLSWTAGTDAVTPQNQLVYEIHYSTTAEDDFEVKGESDPGATSYDVRNLQPGVKYYFRVRCRDAAGNRSGS
jgi:hypothetical protein